jgi:phage tail sheath gpL-like
MAVYFADPTFQRQGVVGGFVLSAPDYSGTPPGTGAAVSFTYAVTNITVSGVTVDIATGYQHWVKIGGGVFSYVQQNGDTASTVATYLANAINSAADALATATASGGTLTLTPRQNTGAAINCTASLSCGTNQGQTMFELTGNELIPAITKGVLFAQATLYNPAIAPVLPAAPASQKSWLFYSSTAGWYWKNSATPNNATDATVGWVVTNATSVIALSSRRLGSGAEVSIVPAGPGSLLLGSAGEDTGVPPLPNFTAAETNSQLVIGGLTLASSTNSAEIAFAEFLLYYVNETAGTTLTLTAALTAAAASLSASASLPASTPGSVTFNFSNVTVGSVTIGPGYVHSISIGAATYTYEQQTEDTDTIIATELAYAINASADPNAYATATAGTVVLTALQNTGANVTCSASDGNTPATLTETEPTYVTIDQEIIQVNAANGSAIARGVLGSTAAAHASGAKIWPVTEQTMVFAIPLFSYGTPNWPTVVGQIPFAGQALVAASCWVANEIGPSPVRTKCFTGQGPYAVDAEGNPLAPDVAGFTAAVTTNINVAGQPYYQFSGTVTVGPAPGSTPEIDVVMTTSAGMATVVYRLMGPFTANAVLNWTSVLFPEPTTGPALSFTPTVVPLNVDGVPTVSAYTVGPLSVPNGTVTPVPAAPNVLSTSTASIFYAGEGNGVGFSFSGSITLPTTWALIGAIAINAISPGGQRIQIGEISQAQITASGGAAIAYVGLLSYSMLVQVAAQAGWKVEFQTYNTAGSPTASPTTTSSITVPSLAAAALVTACSAVDQPTLRWQDAGGALHDVVSITVTTAVVPVVVSLYTTSPSYGEICHGWFTQTTLTQTYQIGAQNNSAQTSLLVPLSAETWTAAAAPGGQDRSQPVPASAAVSAGFAVTGPTLSAPTAATEVTDAYVDQINYTQSAPGGAFNYTIGNCYFTIPIDPQLWFVRLTMQTGSGTGGSFVPGGVCGSNTPDDQGRIGNWWGDWDTPADHYPNIRLVSQTATTMTLAAVFPNPGTIGADGNNTLRLRIYATTRAGGAAGTTTLQDCWSSGVGVSTPGTAAYLDLSLDPTKAQVSAALIQPSTIGVGLVQANGTLGLHSPLLSAGLLGGTFQDQFADWVTLGNVIANSAPYGSPPPSGKYACTMLPGSGNAPQVYTAPLYLCSPGQVFFLTATIRNNAANNDLAFVIAWITPAGTVSSYQGFTFLASGPSGTAWTNISEMLTVPAGCTFAQLFIRMANYTTGYLLTSGEWDIDNVQVAEAIPTGAGLLLNSAGAVQINNGGTIGFNVGGQVIFLNVQALASLPTLPSSYYPVGSVVQLTTTGKIYQNVAGAWSSAQDPAQLLSGALASGVTIAASEVVAGAFVGSTVTLNLNGITTTLGNVYFSGLSEYVGLMIQNNSTPNLRTVLSDDAFCCYTGSTGALAASMSGTAASGGVFQICNSSGTVMIQGLGYNGYLTATTVNAASQFACNGTPGGTGTISVGGITITVQGGLVTAWT